MRNLPIMISLDLMTFVQAFGVGLRAEFADAACAPVPEYLVALMRELDGDQKPPTSISCDAILPTGNPKSLRKVIPPRQRNPALGHCNFSWFQSRGAGSQIASVCETDFAPGMGELCVGNPE